MARTQRLRLGRGSNTVIIENGLDDMVRRFLEDTIPGVLPRMEAEAEDLYNAAQAKWPVKTGRSKAAMNWWIRFPRPDPLDRIEAFVGFEPGEPGSKYAHLVKGRKDDGKQSWRVHLLRPAQERGEKLGTDIAAMVADILAGRGG